MSKRKSTKQRAPSAAKAASAAAGPKPGPVPGRFVVKQIPLALIQDEGDGREDAGDIKALADSIRRQGLLQPIVVFRAGLNGDESFVLAAGRRRLAAAGLLGWKTIPARVFPAAGQEVREAVSAIENLDRRDLTPVEEALAVARLAGALGVRPEDLERGAGDSAALERAAALLGRSVAWIRQRGALLRLCPEVRRLVASGRLPLGQAREIAKLAFAADQQDVADDAVCNWDWMRDRHISQTDADGVRVQSLAEVRSSVASRLSTLRGVPWKPDVDFAGRPACTTCPDNTANSLLFGVDEEDAAPEARCLNTRCYKAKMRAAEKALAEMMKKAAKDKDVRATAAGVRDLVPEYIKPAAAARQLKRARELGKPRARAKGAAALPYDKTPEGRFATARRAWCDETRKRLGAALCASPMRLACFLVGTAHPVYARHVAYTDSPSKAVRKKIEPILKRIASGTTKDLEALTKAFSPTTLLSVNGRVPLWVGRRLAGLLSVALEPEPKLEDFLPKPEPKKKPPKAKVKAGISKPQARARGASRRKAKKKG